MSGDLEPLVVQEKETAGNAKGLDEEQKKDQIQGGRESSTGDQPVGTGKAIDANLGADDLVLGTVIAQIDHLPQDGDATMLGYKEALQEITKELSNDDVQPSCEEIADLRNHQSQVASAQET